MKTDKRETDNGVVARKEVNNKKQNEIKDGKTETENPYKQNNDAKKNNGENGKNIKTYQKDRQVKADD